MSAATPTAAGAMAEAQDLSLGEGHATAAAFAFEDEGTAAAAAAAAAATAGDSSPVGAALCYLRRARAFGRLAGAAAAEAPVAAEPAAAASAAAAAAAAVAAAAIGGGAEEPPMTAAATTAATAGGLSQEDLDSLCVEGPEGEEEEVRRPRSATTTISINAGRVANGCGLSQVELDELCSAAPEASDCGDGEQAEAVVVPGSGDAAAGVEALVPTRASVANKPGPEDTLLRAKRLRAYRGASEALAFAARGAAAAAQDAPPAADGTGLSQAALDDMAVVEPASAAGGAAADGGAAPASSSSSALPGAEEPEALCFLLRRTRAFLGADAAETLARELTGKAGADSEPERAAAATAAAGDEKGLTLPVHDRSCTSPVRLPSRAVDERGPSASPGKDKDSKDAFDQVATPSRRRRSMMKGMSPGSLGLGGASPVRGGA